MVTDSDVLDLARVLQQINPREPLFQHRDLVYSAETFDRETSDDLVLALGHPSRRTRRQRTTP